MPGQELADRQTLHEVPESFLTTSLLIVAVCFAEFDDGRAALFVFFCLFVCLFVCFFCVGFV